MEDKVSEITKRYKQDLRIAKEVGDRSQEGIACHNLGNIHYKYGDLKQAMEFHK